VPSFSSEGRTAFNCETSFRKAEVLLSRFLSGFWRCSGIQVDFSLGCLSESPFLFPSLEILSFIIKRHGPIIHVFPVQGRFSLPLPYPFFFSFIVPAWMHSPGRSLLSSSRVSCFFSSVFHIFWSDSLSTSSLFFADLPVCRVKFILPFTFT